MNATKTCCFCPLLPNLMQQLDRVKMALIKKNNRIKELEGVIERLSRMAFDSDTLQHEQQQLTETNTSNTQSLSLLQIETPLPTDCFDGCVPATNRFRQNQQGCNQRQVTNKQESQQTIK